MIYIYYLFIYIYILCVCKNLRKVYIIYVRVKCIFNDSNYNIYIVIFYISKLLQIFYLPVFHNKLLFLI